LKITSDRHFQEAPATVLERSMNFAPDGEWDTKDCRVERVGPAEGVEVRSNSEGGMVYQIPPRACVPLKRSGSRFGVSFAWRLRMQFKANIADEEALSCPSTSGQILGHSPGFATGRFKADRAQWAEVQELPKPD